MTEVGVGGTIKGEVGGGRMEYEGGEQMRNAWGVRTVGVRK